MAVYFVERPRPQSAVIKPVDLYIFKGKSVDSSNSSRIQRLNKVQKLYKIIEPSVFKGRYMFHKNVVFCEGPSGQINLKKYQRIWNEAVCGEMSYSDSDAESEARLVTELDQVDSFLNCEELDDLIDQTIALIVSDMEALAEEGRAAKLLALHNTMKRFGETCSGEDREPDDLMSIDLKHLFIRIFEACPIEYQEINEDLKRELLALVDG